MKILGTMGSLPGCSPFCTSLLPSSRLCGAFSRAPLLRPAHKRDLSGTGHRLAGTRLLGGSCSSVRFQRTTEASSSSPSSIKRELGVVEQTPRGIELRSCSLKGQKQDDSCISDLQGKLLGLVPTVFTSSTATNVQNEYSACHVLWWKKLRQDLGLVCQDILGCSVRNGIGNEGLRSNLAPQLLQVSLIFSLFLVGPWNESAVAQAMQESFGGINVENSRQLQDWQRTSHSPQNLHSDKFNVGQGKLPSLLENKAGQQQETTLGNEYNLNVRELFALAGADPLCTETYGFLPCSSSVGGNLSLIVIYGYLLLIAAQLISKGSELLLEVMNPGLIGGLLLPILGSLPDALLIFASGSGGTLEEAQKEVMVGVGVLAGSIVMLLTLGWAGSLVAGRCDLSGPEGTAKDRTLTRSLDWTGTGVTTDEQTRVGAWIMIFSTIPYICVQVPLLDGHPAEGPGAALVGCTVAVIGAVAYCIYQIAFPWLQQKRIEEARLQFMRTRALQGVTSFYNKPALRPSKLVQEKAFGPSLDRLKELFASFDINKDGRIQKEELKGLLIGLDLEEEGSIPPKDQVDLWLQEFDVNRDGTLSENEFLTGITKWANRISRENWSRKIQKLETSFLGANDPNFWAAQSSEAKKVLELLEREVAGDDGEEEEKVDILEANSIKQRAAVYLLAGATLAAVFADPLVDSIGGFSESSGIPPFFVAFVVTPFASNASELFSSILFAKMQRKKNISLTFSQLYGAVTMNNTLCLGLFLGVVYTRGLNWDFSSEVTVILLSILTMGAVGGSRTTFPLWLSIPAFAVYPLCIATVAILDNVLGWH